MFHSLTDGYVCDSLVNGSPTRTPPPVAKGGPGWQGAPTVGEQKEFFVKPTPGSVKPDQSSGPTLGVCLRDCGRALGGVGMPA